MSIANNVTVAKLFVAKYIGRFLIPNDSDCAKRCMVYVIAVYFKLPLTNAGRNIKDAN